MMPGLGLAGVRKHIRRGFRILARPRGKLPAVEQDRVRILREKIAPLNLKVSDQPPRVNLLIPTIDLRYVFGGYIAKLNFARRLAEKGMRVRIVIVDWCDYRPDLWRQQLEAFDGLNGLLDRVELAYAFDRKVPLPVSPEDRFVATTWWTAHLAHAACQQLRSSRFLYLIQEYEPFTFPMGSFAALAAESYTYPHSALFSTDFLRDYFRDRHIGVYAAGSEAGDLQSFSFQNAITCAGPVQPSDLLRDGPRRLLFYARPEAHAARNMFELGVLALIRALEAGCFAGEWEFSGIGSVGTRERLELIDGRHIQLIPRTTQASYRKLLRSHDIGLSLMYTPHPSLVPIEMASAGMLVVTNDWENKTASRMSSISVNISAVPPTCRGVEEGLARAAREVGNYGRRASGSRVAWSVSWDESFDERVMASVAELLIEVPHSATLHRNGR